ncbi:glycerophosphodiester phosphodiesterase domain-containing protein 5-like [Heteronotia binoei]|uniref:glycerophosphodiester phosphodiesterase domain-containing protein 5-like n=1 Tax=Heteronotia binoei TaxID=13085 RepID=UPI00293044D4|nr:glycerophosphodiester phosphodiesterase domain-containing protein 5-like [Heteronotia binoei]
MDTGPVTVKKSKFRKLKVARQRLLQRYEHQPFVSCLAGLYSCRWRRYQRERAEPGQWCCSKRECAFYPVLVSAFCFSFIFLYLWGEGRNDYNNFDWFNYSNLGIWFLWSHVLLVMAALSFSYILLLLILAMCLVSEGQQLYLHYCHKIGAVFVLVFSAAVLTVITVLWNVQWQTVVLSVQVTAPFMHVGALLVMVLSSWPVALYTFRLNKKGTVTPVMVSVPYLALLFFLFFIPLGIYSPCIREEGTLGPKPALIGHRGAPMVAPENTLMSFVKTVEHKGDGFETDVTISFDGIPFLMHDLTLERTTNIQELHPANANDRASMFTWDVLSKLNSGKWFFKNPPFYSMPTMPSGEREWAEKQTIYLLSDFLKLADRDNKLVIFDLYRPPEDHPYRDSWINRILEVVLNESKIQPHLVLWLENMDRSHVQATAPEFQQTYGKKAPLEVLRSEKIVKLNLSYKEMSAEDIRMYAENNITTNLYVVSEPWLFSLAWCAGAHSVTTNAVHTLSGMTKPVFLMTPRDYQIMWILTDVLSGILVSLVFLLHWWREKGASCLPGNSTDSLANGSYSTFGTGMSALLLERGLPEMDYSS